MGYFAWLSYQGFPDYSYPSKKTKRKLKKIESTYPSSDETKNDEDNYSFEEADGFGEES